jgi:hypothetical protein
MLFEKLRWTRQAPGWFLTLTLCIAPAWANPQTQDLRGVVFTAQGTPLSGARCKLTGRGLRAEGLAVTTGERGRLEFSGLQPGQYNLTCVSPQHIPVTEEGIKVDPDNQEILRIVLPDLEKLHQTVEVHEQAAAPLESSATKPTEHVTAQQLSTLPLIQQQFQAAMTLVPGVVRSPDGKINIKGATESQGMLMVDSTEMVDPITGSYSIDLPLDAIQSVDVMKAPYNAEYGHFSGGLTSVITKPPSNQWDMQLYNLTPGFFIEGGHLSGVSDESPRIRFTGPLDGYRLTMSESFSYALHRQLVRGLPWPNNLTNIEGVNSFTNFQYIVSPQHLITVNVHAFPSHIQFDNIDSLIPQSASSDYGQSGLSVGINDRRVFTSGGLMTSTFQGTYFSSYGRGQGFADMLITPEGYGGNYFNRYTRAGYEGEGRETYQFPHKDWRGKHELKIGADAVYRVFNGLSRSAPINVLREDNSLAETLSFSGPGSLNASDMEVGIFAQDHWELGNRMALDGGLRLSGQTLGKWDAMSPRLALTYAPGKDNRTIIRAGAGVFYSSLPLMAGSFTNNPLRTLTYFDTSGNQLGSPVTLQNVYAQVDDGAYHVLPAGQDLDSTPFNFTWNAEVDRQVQSRVTVRFSYLYSHTLDLFLVGPQTLPNADPSLLMTNNGGSRYGEFESTVQVRANKSASFNVSYVHSQARGDLNSFTQEYVPFEQPIIHPNFISALYSDIPNRVVAWGQFKIPWKITASPVFDIHSGFPYSAVDSLQNYVDQPNSLRFPTFMSLDMMLSKDFRIKFLPWVKNHTLRGSLSIYNVTNHLNPRDVYNNITSPNFGHWAGAQHRFFDPDIDFVY